MSNNHFIIGVMLVLLIPASITLGLSSYIFSSKDEPVIEYSEQDTYKYVSNIIQEAENTQQRKDDDSKTNKLVEAFKSVGNIAIRKISKRGSFIVIGRENLGDGLYEYSALTAYHVVDELEDSFDLKGFFTDTNESAETPAIITINRDWHDQPQNINVTVKLVWKLQQRDVAVIKFKHRGFIPTIKLATEKEFKQINPADHIYIISSDGGNGVLIKEGTIASTHNISPCYSASADRFDQFRFCTPVWYGSSGGAIVNDQGRLIGVVLGLVIRDYQTLRPLTHSGMAIKSHIFRFALEKSGLHLLEDEE